MRYKSKEPARIPRRGAGGGHGATLNSTTGRQGLGGNTRNTGILVASVLGSTGRHNLDSQMHRKNPLFPPIEAFHRDRFGDRGLSTRHEVFAKSGSNCRITSKKSWLTKTLLRTLALGQVANMGPSMAMWSCITSLSTTSSYHSPSGSNANCGSSTGSQEAAEFHVESTSC